MKTLRYLLIMIGLVSVLSLCAQDLAKQPTPEMRSTSAMVSSGSALPQAAVTGAKTTYDTQPGRTGNARKTVGGDGFEDDPDPAAPSEPFPLGDALWPLALCALAYLLWRVARKRKRDAELNDFVTGTNCPPHQFESSDGKLHANKKE